MRESLPSEGEMARMSRKELADAFNAMGAKKRFLVLQMMEVEPCHHLLCQPRVGNQITARYRLMRARCGCSFVAGGPEGGNAQPAYPKPRVSLRRVLGGPAAGQAGQGMVLGNPQIQLPWAQLNK